MIRCNIGRLLSQAPTSSYKTPPLLLQSGLRRANLPDGRSKIAVKRARLWRIQRSDPTCVGLMTGLNRTTDVRLGAGNSKSHSTVRVTFESLNCIDWTLASLTCFTAGTKHRSLVYGTDTGIQVFADQCFCFQI